VQVAICWTILSLNLSNNTKGTIDQLSRRFAHRVNLKTPLKSPQFLKVKAPPNEPKFENTDMAGHRERNVSFRKLFCGRLCTVAPSLFTKKNR